MATKYYTICSLLVFVLVLGSRGGAAQSGCSNNVISGLSSCISYLRGNSSRPLPSCCTSLANVEQTHPECLCPMLSNGASATLGIAVNRTLAMAMPATCKLRTPQCDDAADGPVASSPAISPPSPPPDASSPPFEEPTAVVPTSDFPSGSKTFPTSDGTAVTSSIYLNLFMVAASIIATFHFQH